MAVVFFSLTHLKYYNVHFKFATKTKDVNVDIPGGKKWRLIAPRILEPRGNSRLLKRNLDRINPITKLQKHHLQQNSNRRLPSGSPYWAEYHSCAGPDVFRNNLIVMLFCKRILHTQLRQQVYFVPPLFVRSILY